MSRFTNLEFHRSGFGLLPARKDRDPGTAICLPAAPGGAVPRGSCTCAASKKDKTCQHHDQLANLVSEFHKTAGNRSWGEILTSSLWYRLGQALCDGDSQACSSVRVAQIKIAGNPVFACVSPKGQVLAQLFDHSQASQRFLERAGKAPHTGFFLDRASLLQKLALLLRTDEERQLNEVGFRSRRQALEESFWGRLVYHCFREYGDRCSFHPAIEQQSSDFTLVCRSSQDEPILKLVVPRRQVRKVINLLAREFPQQADLAIHPVPLKSIFKVSESTKLDLEVRPVIQALQSSGETRFFAREELEKFRYGDLVYIKELQLLAELEQPGIERKFASPISMTLKRSQVPSFLEEHRGELEEGIMILEERLRNLKIFKDYDYLEIVPDALKRSWYWLSIRYGFGSQSIALTDILRARREGLSYMEIESGWVDLTSPAFSYLETLEKRSDLLSGAAREKIRLSAVDLLRLTSSAGRPVQLRGQDRRTAIVKRLLALEPSEPFRESNGLATPLRPYQRIGVDWMKFLYENRLAGLLCDDMGLGKTHQAMALMVWLRERHHSREPFLVISPTTVISHWRNKIRDHAPGLKSVVYHGSQRNVKEASGEADVFLTSYGVLRNDVLRLQKIPFALVVFDEIQNLKNRDTQSYQAASVLKARMKVGLTGTPIENSLDELKSLFDLILPGYLGTDEEFGRSCTPAPGDQAISSGLAHLRRVIAPFVLRRVKKAVLDELPEKIEDLRTCQLSEVQVKLYRDAISTRAAPLLEQLQSNNQPLPYIHIFALLNLLKRICDHPALVLGSVEDYQKYESGKWELFQELLFESLDSGHKVVVFSQYLGMIAMMERLLESLDVGFVTLTGSTLERGEIVRRFNDQPDCRVFLGSLKAGGTGIDLVGGSVVLHYDRWWNAAREDQATDRVYRIGQKKAVQIFNLITEGTLEEKISAIIERKRRLMNTVVQADDPHLNKIFSREELIEMLQPV